VIGVPDPAFCLNNTAPALPASWPGAEASGYYYIDNTHPDATDTSNTYGYPNRPRVSIPVTYAAGSYVEIHGGPYDSSATLTLAVSGTSTNPVWFRGSSPTTRPTLRRTVAVQGTYAIVEHLYFDVTARTLRVNSNGSATTDHICIRNLEFAGPGLSVANNAVISISGTASFPTTNVIIYNNIIHGFGDWQGAVENDYHGILPASYANNVWVLNNLVYNMGGDSIQVGQANYSVAERPNYIYIGGNVFHHDRENAVDIKSASDVIVSQNTMYGYAAVSSSSGEVVAIHDDPSYVWVMFNDVSDGQIGLITTGSTDTWFIGNVIRNINHSSGTWDGTSLYALGAAIHFRGASTGGALHNTLYNYDIGIQIPPGGTGYVVRNNIFAGRAEATGMDVRVDSSNTIFDNNLLYGQGGAVRIGWSSASAVDLAAFKTNTGKCVSCPATADPLFLNVGAGNFRIPSNSPAANTGATDSAFTTFFNRYGISIASDFQGNARTIGASPDIGAYESDAQ